MSNRQENILNQLDAKPVNAAPASQADARRWMAHNAEEHVDACNARELNCTGLAEACAEALNLYTDDDGNIPEWLFDMAVDVETARAERYDERTDAEQDADDDREESATDTGRYAGGYRTFRNGSEREDFGSDR